MARRVVLFVDLLGVQAMWTHGGADLVRSRIGEFSDFIIRQMNYLPNDLHRDGDYTLILMGDGAAVTCQDYSQAIGMGIHLFTQAYYATDKVTSPFWLRGAVGPWSNQHLTMNTERIRARGMDIGTRYAFEDDFLSIMALEKSGYRGMRLIVDTGPFDPNVAEYQRQWEGFRKPLRLVTRLREFAYPQSSGEYADVLWMADRSDRYDQLKDIMASRFKKCTRNPQEFTQAAWTRAVFDQVESIVWTCRRTSSGELGADSPPAVMQPTEVLGIGAAVPDAPTHTDDGADEDPLAEPPNSPNPPMQPTGSAGG